MPPTVNQEINVNINALVRGIQSVRELRDLIRSFRENRSAPVIVDEKISRNAKANAGDVKQLQTSIEQLAGAINKLNDEPVGKLARAFHLLASVSTILGHIKGSVEGIQFLFDLGNKFPAFGQKISSVTNGVKTLFSATREKIGDGLAKARDTIAGLTDKLPRLVSSGGSAAGTIGSIGVAGAGAAIGVGALAVVLAAVLAVVLALVAAIGAAGFLFKLAEGAAEAGSTIHDMSQELGVSAEILSTIQVASRTTSTTFEEAAQSISKFNKLIGEAADGSKEAAHNLTRLGVDPKEALKDSEAALAKVFKRIHELPTPYEKARAAQIAFGKSGQNMVPIIDSVGGSLEKAKDKAAEFGKLLTTQAANDADEFGDQLDELQLRVEGLGESIGRALIPSILQLLRIFTSEMPGASGIFQTFLAAITLKVQQLVNETIIAIAALKTLAALPAALGVLIGTGNLEQAFAIIRDRFKAELTELLRVANTPATGGGSTGKSFEFGGTDKGKKPGEPPSTFEAQAQERRAKVQSEFNLEKDFLEKIEGIYQTALDNRRIATDDYYDALEGFRRRELAAALKQNHELQKIERERRDAEIADIEKDKDSTKLQKVNQKINAEAKFQAAIAPLEEEFKRLFEAAENLPLEIETAEKATLDALDKQISAFLAKVDEANGRTAAAAAEAIDAEFKELLERVTIEQGENSPLVKLVKEFIQLQKDRARVKQIDEQLQPLGQQFEIQRLEIETRISKETITQKQGRKELIQLQRKYLEGQLEILKAELASTNEARTQLEIKLRIAQLQKQLADLKEIDETARSINENLRFAFEDFFASIADGTKSIKEAFADLGRFILQLFARLAAQKLVESLFGNVFGDTQGQGGIGGILSGIFGGKKAAGDLMNARPGGQLIQVAEAGFDELVVTTDPRYAARTAGLLGRFMERTGIVPQFAKFGAGGFARSVGNTFANIPRLAAGAFVPAPGPEAAFAAAGFASELTLNQTHNHVWNPRHLHDEMRGPAGQDTFLHNVGANKTTIKRILGIR